MASSRRFVVLTSPRADGLSALFPEILTVRNLPLLVFMLEMKEARYVAAVCSLMLMVLLVVGTLAYAGIRRLTSPAAAAASVARVADVAQPVPKQNSADDADPLVTPAAIVLAMIAALAIVGRSNPPRRESATVPHR